ncbi:Nucleotide-binding oligomerization domain-containing protein 2, partial [Clarias magur]
PLDFMEIKHFGFIEQVTFANDLINNLVNQVKQLQNQVTSMEVKLERRKTEDEPPRKCLRTQLEEVWSIDLSRRKASVFLEVLRLQTTKKAVKLRDYPDEESEVRSFLQCLSYTSQLKLCSDVLVRMTQAKALMFRPPVILDELFLTDSGAQQPDRTTSIILSSLHFLLRHWNVQCLNLTESKIVARSLVDLLYHQGSLTIRVDRRFLLRLLHCCDVRELHQDAAVLLSALHHKLDFSSYDALDLTADTTSLYLSSQDCRVVFTAIHRAHTPVQVTLQDCEIEDRGVELLFPVLHTVSLRCSKALLLHLLDLVDVGTETERVRRAVALSRALSGEMDLSETRLNLQTFKSLALVLEYSEGLSELDLSHCQLTDQHVELLLPHLHKPRVIDLSHNLITDASARSLYHIVSVNSHIQTV